MRRLPPGHAKQPAIIADIKKIKAGYNGEYRVFQSLIALPEKEYLLFHDLRLIGSPFPFQIDILILTSSFLLILEVKTWLVKSFSTMPSINLSVLIQMEIPKLLMIPYCK
ncbi:nuclease-related domain-containing protein [Peribacillus sp. ACCC06369]|uniref:nuclease-related domain-containing protein n=1 Tax=Peribacillus sp. ACCC06369 TaxID=3055860 RepID=UPI00338D9A7C